MTNPFVVSKIRAWWGWGDVPSAGAALCRRGCSAALPGTAFGGDQGPALLIRISVCLGFKPSGESTSSKVKLATKMGIADFSWFLSSLCELSDAEGLP